MVAAANQLGPVGQHDAVRGLDRGPVGQHGGADIFAVAAAPDRSVDFVSGAHLSQRGGPAVRHQDGRLTLQAISTCVLAAPVGVDGPPERHPGRLGYPVDHRLGLHLEEGHAAEARGVEGAGDRTALDEREHLVSAADGEQVLAVSGYQWLVEPQVVPTHTEYSRMNVRSWQAFQHPARRKYVTAPAMTGRERGVFCV